MGALAFNTLRASRDWPDAVVKRLQLVGKFSPTRWLESAPTESCGKARSG